MMNQLDLETGPLCPPPRLPTGVFLTQLPACDTNAVQISHLSDLIGSPFTSIPIFKLGHGSVAKLLGTAQDLLSWMRPVVGLNGRPLAERRKPLIAARRLWGTKFACW